MVTMTTAEEKKKERTTKTATRRMTESMRMAKMKVAVVRKMKTGRKIARIPKTRWWKRSSRRHLKAAVLTFRKQSSLSEVQSVRVGKWKMAMANR